MHTHLFRFVTRWELPHDLTTVWNSVGLVTQYPQWWPGVRKADLLAGTELPVSVGTKVHFVIASPLYTLDYTTTTVDFVTGEYIAVKAEGDLHGTGKWVFEHTPDETIAIFTWEVSLTPLLLREVSHIPFARSVMGFFHGRLMARGEKALRLRLMRQISKDAQIQGAGEYIENLQYRGAMNNIQVPNPGEVASESDA
jgi:hypothetical protein